MKQWKTIGLVLTPAVMAAAQSMPADYDAVLKTLGKQGDFKSNVLKLNVPRTDVKVTIDGIATPTPFGFGGWLAMTKGTGGNDVMMGDLVLLEDEVNPVMSGNRPIRKPLLRRQPVELCRGDDVSCSSVLAHKHNGGRCHLGLTLGYSRR